MNELEDSLDSILSKRNGVRSCDVRNWIRYWINGRHI
jgi:hypothetical protein